MKRTLSVAVLGSLIPVVHAATQSDRPSAAGSTAACAQLARVALSGATITAAEEIATGEYVPPTPQSRSGTVNPVTNLPTFCRVAVTVAPAIKIEVWMPRDTWNGRYVGEGGGGYAGTISYAGLASRIRAGYAAASTDTGHAQGGGGFALNSDGSLNMGLIKDFSERSLHEMVLKAKSLINAYYGNRPTHSYWNGCSTGGRQGLMAIQRFPEEYDGLVIGAPAINWDRFIPAELWPQIVMKELVGAPVSAAKLNATTAAAVSACDAKDGVTDGIIDNPRACSYDPSALVCRPGDDTATCLSTAEAEAIRKIWDGAAGASGERLWFGLERGAPLTGLAGAMPFGIGTDHFRYWLRQDQSFDWHTLTMARFERDFRESQRKFHDVIGTDKADLSAFRQRGGKMILWHGEADQLIFPRGTINYFNRVLDANGGPTEVNRFARLYMAPGVGHCGGGIGPAPTGLFEAIVDWVEKGVAPTTILAASAPGRGAAVAPTRTRPLCPYPTIAKWIGSGSPNEAANFACVAVNPRPSDFTIR